MKLSMLSDILNSDVQLSDLYKLYKEEEEAKEEITTEKKVSKLLYDLALAPSYKGYKYLKDAITMLCDNELDYESITKDLYPAVAKKFDTTSQNVEKNIRFAIRKIYEFNTPENLEELLGRSPAMSSKPSNVKFIACCAEKIRLER